MSKLSDMIANLEMYPLKGTFQFKPTDILSKVCDIPVKKDFSGLYLFYNDSDELIYIGISGREGIDGKIIHRKDGLRGRFLTGKQFGDRRSITLPKQMKSDGISMLKIHWFVTYGGSSIDLPRPIEIELLEIFKEQFGRLPRWNKRI